MTDQIEEIARQIGQRVAADVRFHGWIREDSQDLNAMSRALVDAYHAAHGEAWIGVINVYSHHAGPVIWQYDPDQPLYNFGAAFVLPAYDEELERLIVARKEAPYTGTTDDYARVSEITDRIAQVGGRSLFWA